MTYQMKVRRKGDYFVAFLTARIGRDASITVRAKVAISAVAKILKSTYQGRVEVGSSVFRRIWDSAKGIAKKAAQSKALKSGLTMLRHPDLKKISSIISSHILAPALLAIKTTLKVAKYYQDMESRPGSTEAKEAARKLKEAVTAARRLQSQGNARGNTLANALRAGKQISIPRIVIEQRDRMLA